MSSRGFSKGERRGIVAVALLALLLMSGGLVVKHYRSEKVVQNAVSIERDTVVIIADGYDNPKEESASESKKDSGKQRKGAKKRGTKNKSDAEKKEAAPALPPRDFLNER